MTFLNGQQSFSSPTRRADVHVKRHSRKTGIPTLAGLTSKLGNMESSLLKTMEQTQKERREEFDSFISSHTGKPLRAYDAYNRDDSDTPNEDEDQALKRQEEEEDKEEEELKESVKREKKNISRSTSDAGGAFSGD